MRQKYKYKTSLGLMVMFVFFLLNITITNVGADPFSSIEINRYDAVLVIDDDGDMHVTETWDMKYLERYTVRFRDIEYRKFPVDYPLPFSEDNIASFNTSQYSIKVTRSGLDYTDAVTVGYSFNNDLDERRDEVACPSESDSLCESIFINFSPIGGLSGSMQIEYNYIIEDVVTEYSDVSEINWVLFKYAESSVRKGSIDIFLPSNTNEVDDIDVFTPLIRNSDFDIFSNQNIRINFENMKANEQLGFRLLVPTNTFSSIEATNIFINEDMNRQVIIDFEEQLARENQISSILFIILLCISIVNMIYYGYLINKQNKTLFAPHKTLAKDQVINTIPTEHKPAVVGYLYNNQVTSDEDISATLLDLISKEYLIIDDSRVFDNSGYSLEDLLKGEKKNIDDLQNGRASINNFEPVTFNRTYEKLKDDFDMDLVLNKEKSYDDLETFEMHLIDWYINKIGDGDKVSIKKMINMRGTKESREYIEETSKFKKFVKESCNDIIYYDDISEIRTEANTGYFLIILLSIITIVCSVLFNTNVLIPVFIYFLTTLAFFTFLSTRKRKSYFIQNFYEKWTKYKENLETINVLKTAPISDVDFWDNNLVYATVFGIAEKVLIQLQSVYNTNLNTEDEGRKTITPSHWYYYRCYQHRMLRNYHRKIYTTANYNAGGTSTRGGSSFGGGFRGGGSFGGGGGGGRSR